MKSSNDLGNFRMIIYAVKYGVCHVIGCILYTDSLFCDPVFDLKLSRGLCNDANVLALELLPHYPTSGNSLIRHLHANRS